MNIIRTGLAIARFQEWLSRWKNEGLSVSERLGLLHHGFDKRMSALNSIEDRVSRLEVYLTVADKTTLSEAQIASGGLELSAKARSVLVTKVFSRDEKDSEARLMFVPPHDVVLFPLLIAFLCNRDGRTRSCNWSYAKSEGGHEDIKISAFFFNILRHVMHQKEAYAEDVRDKLILTAFLEAPAELWGRVIGCRNESGRLPFNKIDLGRLLDQAGSREQITALTGSRYVEGDYGHSDVLNLMKNLVARVEIPS